MKNPFDGDEMNIFIFVDNVIYDAGRYLDTFYGIHDITNLGQLSKAADIPDVNMSIIGNWINEPVLED